MDKGNFTKYPPIFKANEIIERQRKERISIQNENDSNMSSSKRHMGKSMNGFNMDGQMRNTLRMNHKHSNLYNSIDVS
jgi:hypothetical protein